MHLPNNEMHPRLQSTDSHSTKEEEKEKEVVYSSLSSKSDFHAFYLETIASTWSMEVI